MISLLQAIIAFVLLGLGTLYYFKTRSPPVMTKSDDDDPLEDIKPKPEPTKTTPVVAKEPDVDQEPEILVTSAKPEDKPEDELVKPTPTTTPAKPLVRPQTEASTMIIGQRGKFASEGGYDLNNKTDRMTFPRVSSADIHIEHVDVHRGNPANKNASITFKYQGGIVHKFTFVGNGGLSFRKQDGSFGPNLGVGDASSVVLTGMGLPKNSYKIECTRTTGRNTWHFKPLDLSKGLVGIEISDNADWGGLRGLYVKALS
jgi:hypothetical protein